MASLIRDAVERASRRDDDSAIQARLAETLTLARARIGRLA
jgi:hypothetical protein